jgi:hypothetical protein
VASAAEDAPVDDPWTPTPDKNQPVIRAEDVIEVDAVGNSQFKARLRFPPAMHLALERMMSRPYVEGGVLRWRPPKVASMLRYLDLESAGAVMEGLDGGFDDEVIRVEGREVGFARQRDGRWVHELSAERKRRYHLTRRSTRDGVTSVTLNTLRDAGGTAVVSEMRVTLPRGAHDVHVEYDPSRLVYSLAAAPKGEGTGGRPSFSLQTKPHVMSALYKLYGDPRFHKLWVARGLFRNTTGETLTDYRVRFRLAGYSEWGRWEASDIVAPGQTVVDPCYPVIDARVRELTGPTPVDVQVEYSYVRADGRRESDTYSERTRLLGMNEGVYSDLATDQDSTWYEMFKDAPLLLASFTTANDPVIRDVVGLLGKATGGAATSLRDEDALAFLRALYDLMRANVKYETTPGDRVDGLLHQHLKYGRDVLRTKSGTCVNTAIFYASVAEAAGLEPFIFVVSGHAFAGARLPGSRKLVMVETTKATYMGGAPFEEAVAAAAKKYAEAVNLGLIMAVDIHQQRQLGVTPPELPDAGRNPLKEWGIVLPGEAPAAPGPGPEPAAGDKTAEEYNEEGKAFLHEKKWAEAAECFTKAIGLNDKTAKYYFNRGAAYGAMAEEARKAGEDERAMRLLDMDAADLVKGLEIDPNNAKAWNNAGALFSALDKHREALGFFSRAIELDPNYALAYRNRAKTYRKLGDRARANADMRKADELDGGGS